MKKIIVASNNEHKIEEIKAILSKFKVQVISLKEAGIYLDVEENGTTFMENAYKKASEIFDVLNGEMVISDDSGLVVDSLGGAPGVFSARYAGEHGNDEKNNEKLLRMLRGKDGEERTAKFVCAMVLIVDKNTVIKVQGDIEGVISNEYKGNTGFGYDPIFVVPDYNKTFAELGAEVKNVISHRAVALRKLEVEMSSVFQEGQKC